jgi:hypothetical protein
MAFYLSMAEDDDALAAEKRKLEVEKLRAEVNEHRWKRVQFITIYVGTIISFGTLVGVYFNYKKSVEDTARRDLQTAIEHHQKGWLTGIVELGAHGPEGLQALVYGVDGAGKTAEPGWPRVTVATLDELAKRQKALTEAQRASLVTAQKENHEALEQVVLRFESLRPGEEAPDRDYQRLGDLVCVQSKLRVIVGTPSDADWKRVDDAARALRPGLSDC